MFIFTANTSYSIINPGTQHKAMLEVINLNDSIYISQWKTFLETPYAEHHVPDWHQKLQLLHTVTSYSDDEGHVEDSLSVKSGCF